MRVELVWMRDFKVESRDMKLCLYVCFLADQIFKNSECFPMTKKLSQAFVSKQVAKTFQHSAKQSVEILKSSEETKSWVQCLKTSLREKCPNTEFFLVRIFPHSDWIRRDTPVQAVVDFNSFSWMFIELTRFNYTWNRNIPLNINILEPYYSRLQRRKISWITLFQATSKK